MHLSPDMWGKKRVEVACMGQKPFEERLSTRFFNWCSNGVDILKENALLIGGVVVGASLMGAVCFPVLDNALGKTYSTVAEVIDTQYIPAHSSVIPVSETHIIDGRAVTSTRLQNIYVSDTFYATVQFEGIDGVSKVSIPESFYHDLVQTPENGEQYAATYNKGRWSGHVYGNTLLNRLEDRRATSPAPSVKRAPGSW